EDVLAEPLRRRRRGPDRDPRRRGAARRRAREGRAPPQRRGRAADAASRGPRDPSAARIGRALVRGDRVDPLDPDRTGEAQDFPRSRRAARKTAAAGAMMTEQMHRRFEDDLSAYIDAELEAPARAELEAHPGGC